MQQPNNRGNAQRQSRTPNAKHSHPSSYPSTSQHEPTLHTTAQTQHNMQTDPINTTSDAPNRQRHHRLSSSSEDTDDIQHASNNDWQIIRSTKRKKVYSSQPTASNTLTEKHNRYDILTKLANQAETGEQSRPPQKHKLPPIFIHGVINYGEMIKRICEVAEDEQYYTNSMANNVIKLNCTTPDTYRNLIKYFKENESLNTSKKIKYTIIHTNSRKNGHTE